MKIEITDNKGQKIEMSGDLAFVFVEKDNSTMQCGAIGQGDVISGLKHAAGSLGSIVVNFTNDPILRMKLASSMSKRLVGEIITPGFNGETETVERHVRNVRDRSDGEVKFEF